MNWEEYGRKRS